MYRRLRKRQKGSYTWKKDAFLKTDILVLKIFYYRLLAAIRPGDCHSTKNDISLKKHNKLANKDLSNKQTKKYYILKSEQHKYFSLLLYNRPWHETS